MPIFYLNQPNISTKKVNTKGKATQHQLALKKNINKKATKETAKRIPFLRSKFVILSIVN